VPRELFRHGFQLVFFAAVVRHFSPFHDKLLKRKRMCLRIPVWCVVQSQTFLLTPEQQKMFIIESRARISLSIYL
jgi:hypothetical protein